MTIFFTADTHFGDAGIIKSCNRPFKTVEEMNKTLIDNWNSLVRKEDIVYHLGDFGDTGFLNKLSGNMIFIRGNHDPLTIPLEFTRIKLLGQDLDEDVDLMHDPVLSILGYSEISFHGHVHTLWKYLCTKDGKVLVNVGTDVWNFKPVNATDALDVAYYAQRNFTNKWKIDKTLPMGGIG